MGASLGPWTQTDPDGEQLSLDPPPESWLGPHMDKSPQAVFDKVVAHLRQQNARSTEEGSESCMYRGAKGRMCAAGCLIPDSEYTPDMEGGAVDSLAFFDDWCPNSSNLISRLQRLHDAGEPDDWEAGFAYIAVERGLDYTAP